jgi:hypothetical protein
MGRKAAYTGESASDRATNIMDKFIKRNNNKNQVLQNSTARQKDPNVPINLWPFKDQIEYYNNNREECLKKFTKQKHPSQVSILFQSHSLDSRKQT